MAKSTFFQDFKAFAIKGNAVDLAVGVIIGGAFGKIVSSIVNDLIMPPIGWLIGGVDFKDLSLKLPAAIEGQTEVTINYGNFIQTVFDFIIVAFCVLVLRKKNCSRKFVTCSKSNQKLNTQVARTHGRLRHLSHFLYY